MANKLKRLLIVIVLEAFNAALSKGQGKKLLCMPLQFWYSFQC